MFESIDMGDEIVAVPVGKGTEKVQGILRLNKEGKEILDLLKSDISEDEILRYLLGKYETDAETLKQYINKVINLLRSRDLIE